MGASWAKMSASLDGNPKIRRAGRAGREVFLFVLRRNADLDQGGRVPEIYIEPWHLADQLMMPEAEAVSGLSQCVRTGLLRVDDGFVVIVGWDDEWGKRPLTEAERKRQQRAKTRTSDEESGHVTEVSGHKWDSPECHGSEESRIEESRGEKNIGTGPAKPSRPQRQPKAVPDPVPDHGERASDKPTKSRRAKPKFEMPEGWEPDPGIAPRARAKGIDFESELNRFKLHHAAKGSVFADWNAALKYWLSNASKWDRRTANSNHSGGGGNSALQAVLDIARGEA